MELLSLKLTEENEHYYYFIIKVKYGFFKKKIESFECYRRSDLSQSRFISNGESIYRKFSGLDDSINAILMKEFKNYLKGV